MGALGLPQTTAVATLMKSHYVTGDAFQGAAVRLGVLDAFQRCGGKVN